MFSNLANFLTLLRIILIPVLIALFFIPGATAAWACLFIYAIAAITDFFDGWAARKFGQTSIVGKFLDPIADKLLVIVMLFMLVAFDRLTGIWILPAIVIIVREISIAGLREFLGPYNVTVPVSKLAKWKTTVQMLAVGFVMMREHGTWLVKYTAEIGEIGMTVAAILTVITGWGYLKVGYKTIIELDQKS